MKLLRQLSFTVILVVTLYGCKKNESPTEIPSDDLDNISRIQKDSIYIDKNGNKVIVRFNAKIEEVENSINGKVNYAYGIDNQGEYTYDKYGKISKSIYKDEYRNGVYNITINDDTLNVGETFNALVWSKYTRYKVQITEPKKETVSSELINDYHQFEFVCLKSGIYTFKGQVVSDSTSFMFCYRFIVK